MTDSQDALQAAEGHLQRGHTQEALALLAPHLAYPCQLETDELGRGLGLFAQLAALLGGAELSDLLRAAAELDDVSALYDAAYALYEEGQHRVAATLLDRALFLAPGTSKLLSELSSNLEALMDYREAARRLRESEAAESSPICRYLLAFNELMCGELEGPRAALPALLESGDPQIQGMAGDLAAMLARADAVAAHTPLDARDLAGWHLVLNGSLLLHLSPHGFDAPMRGRYAYLGDSYGLLREGIERLGAVLRAGDLAPTRVISAPDRSSQILAHATATHLGLPLEPWPSEGAPAGLVVAYDLDQVGDADVFRRLKLHAPGQILFAHVSSWTKPFPYAPDVTTLLAQQCASPWGAERLVVDPESGEVVCSTPDEAPVEELAAQILDAELSDPSQGSLEDLCALVAAVRTAAPEHTAGLFRASGPRRRQRAGSAVPSNRFL